MKRTLALKKEALTELSTDELVGVAGGTTPITRTCTPIITSPSCVIVTVIVETVLEGCLP
jgi:hypothetical protein